MSAPVGNKFAAKGKEWFDAVRKQCVQRQALDAIAKIVVDKALEGEQWAIQEIACRYDGKPAQAVTVSGDPDNPLAITRIERAIVRTNPAD